MAIEDYFDVYICDDDEESHATLCEYCDMPIWFEELPRRKWRIWETMSGQIHICPMRNKATKEEFPLC